MGKYKIEHDRPNCIACASCWIIFPKFWKEGEEGKSDIIGGKRRGDGWEEVYFEEEDKQGNMDAAESCPVNVIHIIDAETTQKII